MFFSTHIAGDIYACHWASVNIDSMQKMPFYATLAEKESFSAYQGKTDHWFPRHVNNNDAERCEVYKYR